MAKPFILVRGLPEIKGKLKALLAAYPEATRAAIYQKGLQIAGDAVKLTPVATGFLRRSNYVKPPDSKGLNGEIGYGASYAVPVHERTDVAHPQGEAKFLDKAINAHRINFVRDVGTFAATNAKNGTKIGGVSADLPNKPLMDR